MAKHWSEYNGSALTDRQIGALDAMARDHDFADGLALLAAANGMSRSKVGKALDNKHSARPLINKAFEVYGR